MATGKTPEDVSSWAIGDIMSKFDTSLVTGLSSAEAQERLVRNGRNELEKPPKPTFLMLFVRQLLGFITILLIVAACASVVVNATSINKEDILSYTTGKAIFIIVFLNAGIAAWTEHKAGGALEALSKMSQATVSVLRDGEETRIDTSSVVQGDLVILDTGDVVPADIRLCDVADMKVSEIALTGEPDDVTKTIRMKPKKHGDTEKLTPENMVFSGCSITSGKGRGIVIETGMSTRIGHIAQLINSKNSGEGQKKCLCLRDVSGGQTPLQQSLEALGKRIGILAIVVCAAVFIIGLAVGRNDPMNQAGETWLYMVLISVTLAVAAIPEGIPLCVTISLSMGCKAMVQKNVLVRKLPAVETLGAASVICSDKTGTLTEGKMRMVQIWSAGREFDVSGRGFDPTVGKVCSAGTDNDARDELVVKSTLLAGLLCSNTVLTKVVDRDTGNERVPTEWEPKGNSSEAPIVVAARQVGFGDEVVSNYNRKLEVPFSSSRKMMLVVVESKEKDALGLHGLKFEESPVCMAICKGAPNYIVDACTKQLKNDGSMEVFDQSAKDQVMDIVDTYSSRALRVLAIAARPMSTMPFDETDEELSADEKFSACRRDLCLLGLVASIDPERDGVRDSVLTARGAGIRVVMITGDYVKTAIAIAHNVSILTEGDDDKACAVDCAMLRPNNIYLEEDEMDRITKTVRVFARAKPEDKLEIVKSLQRQRYVTAMTGDGVNDAPALTQADIGVAMGITGTEVAKGAADMILQDDDFCSIVAAVEKGRVIYAGIQKFVAFIMSVHMAEVMQIFTCIAIGIPVMRSPLQILFLILVTDLPPSIALGMEPGDSTVLKQKPRPKEEPVVLGFMWLSQVMNATCLTIVIMGVYLAALMHYCDGEVLQDKIEDMEGLKDARTVAFISLVLSENVRAYCARSFDRPFFVKMLGNWWMQGAIMSAQLFLIIAVFVPVVSEDILELRGVKIGGVGWLYAVIGPIATLLSCEGCKIITHLQMRSYQRQLAVRQNAVADTKDTTPVTHVPLNTKTVNPTSVDVNLTKATEIVDEIVRISSGLNCGMSDAVVKVTSGLSNGGCAELMHTTV